MPLAVGLLLPLLRPAEWTERLLALDMLASQQCTLAQRLAVALGDDCGPLRLRAPQLYVLILVLRLLCSPFPARRHRCAPRRG
jgi:hypothetical protein